MTTLQPRAALLLLVGASVALACEPPLPEELACTQDSDCDPGKHCDTERGLCRPGDAGVADRTSGADGAAIDAGSTDSARDASAVDAAAPDALSPWFAGAGADQQVALDDVVTLSAVHVQLPDAGAVLAYTWNITAAPGGSQVALSDAHSAQTSFVALDPHAQYQVELRFTVDGHEVSTDRVQIEVLNSLPVASAGDDLYLYPGDDSALDGSASTDPDGDTLSFAWSVDEAAHGSLTDAFTATPTYQSAAGYSGSAEIELTVQDGHGGEHSDTLQVVTDSDLPPLIEGLEDVSVAHSCADQPIMCQADVALAVQVTEPEGQAVELVWSLLDCPDGAPSAGVCPSGVEPSFDDAIATATGFHVEAERGTPIAGDYRVELAATDTAPNRITAEATITVENAAPLAQGVTTTVSHTYSGGTWYCQIPFDLGASDADGDTLDYDYAVSPGGAVTPGSGSSATFLVTTQAPTPAFLGPYQVSATIADGQGASVQVESTLSCLNTPPVISDAQNNSSEGHYCQCSGAPFEYTGPVSLEALVDDADLDRVDCTWSVPAPDPDVTYHLLPKVEPPLEPPPSTLTLVTDIASVDDTKVLAEHQLLLTCSDGFSADSESFTLTYWNRAPVVSAGPDMAVEHSHDGSYHASAALSGRAIHAVASDPDSDPIVLSWRAVDTPSGVTVSFAPSASVLEPTVTIDGNISVCGAMTFELSAEDSLGEVSVDTMNITVGNRAPVVSAGEDLAVNHSYLGSDTYQAVLDLDDRGTKATVSDADGDPVLLSWTALSLPAGVTASFSPGSQVLNPQVTIQGDTDVVGAFSFRLSVTDPLGLQDTDDVTLTVLNRPPAETVGVAFDPVKPTTSGACRRPGAGTECEISTIDVTDLSTEYTGSFADPDGDPVRAVLSITANDGVNPGLSGASQSGDSITFDFTEGTLEAVATARLGHVYQATACSTTILSYRFYYVTRDGGRWYNHVAVATRVDDPFTSVYLSDSFDAWATNPVPSCP